MLRWLCCLREEDNTQSCWWVCCTKETYREIEEEEEKEEDGERAEEEEGEEREKKEEKLGSSLVETRSSDSAVRQSADEESESRGWSGDHDCQSSGGVDAGEGGGGGSWCCAFEGEQRGCRGKSGTPQLESKVRSTSEAGDEVRGKQWDDHLHARDSEVDTREDDRHGDDLLKRKTSYWVTLDQQGSLTDSETYHSHYRDSPVDSKSLDKNEISSQNQSACYKPDVHDSYDDWEHHIPEHGGDFNGNEPQNRQLISEDVDYLHVPEYNRCYESIGPQFVEDYFYDTGGQHLQNDGDLTYQELSVEERYAYRQAHLEGAEHETLEYVDSEDCTDYSDHLHRCTTSNTNTISRLYDEDLEELEAENDTFKDQKSESGGSEDVAEFGDHLRRHSFSNDSTKRRQNKVEDQQSFDAESGAQTFEYRVSECGEPLYHVKESSDEDSDEFPRNETAAYDDFTDDTEDDEYFQNYALNVSRTKQKQNVNKLKAQTFQQSENRTTVNQSQNTSNRPQNTRIILNSKLKQRGQTERSSGDRGVQKNVAEKAVGRVPKVILAKNVEVTTARPHKIMSNTGILEVESNMITGSKAKVFFHRDALYLNQKKVEDGKPLWRLLKKQNQQWGCVARAFPVKNGSYKNITGVEVHLIASLVWVGDRPSSADVRKMSRGKKPGPESEQSSQQPLKAGSLSREKKPGPESGQSSLQPPQAGGTAQAKEGNYTLKADLADSASPKSEMVRGRISGVTASCAVLQMPKGAYANFRSDQCFLYGVCLQEVQLSEVIPEGTEAEYEMCEGLKDLKGVWVGGSALLDPSELYTRLEAWCKEHEVPHRTAASLLCMAGWLPVDLEPVTDLEPWKEIVEVSRPAIHWKTVGKHKH
ncbi:uncharacterized protein LOC125033699 isoform X2 [Penaeus chinensis]|nr:uncharacterized protein LOC125033699 isoform X2 [Penaeus chinensis]XP_047481370.1 uncharacterized protein LOC125033699 isoform X2 [Penaeus chinensis]XP_047481371.1 uncharacterized protein LOC125033699 isoform X2 [Penaeus chinensis]